MAADALNVSSLIEAAPDRSAKCAVALSQFRWTSLFRGVFTMLLFAVAVALAFTLIRTIISVQDLIAASNDQGKQLLKALEAIIAFLGVVVSGAALAWIVARRNDMVTENNAAADRVGTYCGDEKQVEAMNSQPKFLGY
jgi:hypothetical protein